MKQLAAGIDLVEIQRISRLLDRYGERLILRIFTPAEAATCGDKVERLAARFAAKEAVSKALGTGIGKISWREIEIVSDPAGCPQLQLHGSAADLACAQGLNTWAISLSHTREHAIAFVVASAE